MSANRRSDIDTILERRRANGGDYWASEDGRIYVGNPFSTIGALGMLYELGVGADHEAVQGALGLILAACRSDGRIRVSPKAPLYPCYTAEAARMLARFGLERAEEAERAVTWLLDNAHETGGWRCSFSRFGKGPETEFADPGATLYALDVLRFYPELRHGTATVDRAVESLLSHWETRVPIGPCHWGIGSRFLTVEYPFRRYNEELTSLAAKPCEPPKAVRAVGGPTRDEACTALKCWRQIWWSVLCLSDSPESSTTLLPLPHLRDAQYRWLNDRELTAKKDSDLQPSAARP